MTKFEEEERIKDESSKNIKKLILIDNWDDLGLNPKQRRRFLKFYYDNFEMGLLEALDEFKKK